MSRELAGGACVVARTSTGHRYGSSTCSLQVAAPPSLLTKLCPSAASGAREPPEWAKAARAGIKLFTCHRIIELRGRGSEGAHLPVMPQAGQRS